MPSTTTRGAFPYPLGTDAPGTLGFNTAIQNLATQAASVSALDNQGTHASRPSVASANQGTYYWETDTGHLFRSTGSAWQKVDFRPDMLTSLPSSPAQGDEFILINAFARGRTYWRFAYDAAGIDVYKWIQVGGHPLYDIGWINGTMTGDSSFHQPIPGGGAYPALSIPLPGYWTIRFSASLYWVSGGVPTFYRAGLMRNGVLQTDSVCVAGSLGGKAISIPEIAFNQVETTASLATANYAVSVAADGGGTIGVAGWQITIQPQRVSA